MKLEDAVRLVNHLVKSVNFYDDKSVHIRLHYEEEKKTWYVIMHCHDAVFEWEEGRFVTQKITYIWNKFEI